MLGHTDEGNVYLLRAGLAVTGDIQVEGAFFRERIWVRIWVRLLLGLEGVVLFRTGQAAGAAAGSHLANRLSANQQDISTGIRRASLLRWPQARASGGQARQTVARDRSAGDILHTQTEILHDIFDRSF